MKPSLSLLIALTMFMLLSACSPFVITSSTGEQPTPIVEMETAVPNEPTSVSDEVFPTVGYQAVKVDDVRVEVGVGAPIPVFVHVAGNLPDTCAQVEFIEQVQDGSNFIIKLGTTSSTAQECIPDTLPFQLTLPLNVLDLPIGSYSVEVNGSRADFKIDASASTGDLRTKEMPIYKDDVQVDDVNIETGVGSPIPVHAIVSANLPKSCGQLGEVQLHRDGNNFFVRLIGHLPAETECNNDSLPMRIEIPLNIVNLPAGTYQVYVNGATTTFELPVQ